MPGPNWIPFVSQIKSGFQVLTGDFKGALQTQKDFLQECPVVSQATSTVQLVAGDPEGAVKTQKRCLNTVSNVANGTPGVGHLKGIVHYACGDEEGGDRAMNSATRSTVVIGSGAIATVTTGGVGAIPAAILAGTAYDTAGTAITNKPQGSLAVIDNFIDDPDSGKLFDIGHAYYSDGKKGNKGGKMSKRA